MKQREDEMTMRNDKKTMRMAYAREVRLKRLVRLRQVGAPKWAIKSEQIGLTLNRDGMRYVSVGPKMSQRQAELHQKHVAPLMELWDSPGTPVLIDNQRR